MTSFPHDVWHSADFGMAIHQVASEIPAARTDHEVCLTLDAAD
jgi:hypothetical protein